MNPKQILNNYRLGNMPGSVYRKGGSSQRAIPGYGMGGSRKPVFQNQGQYSPEEMEAMQNMQTLEEQMGPDRLQLVEAANAMAQQLISDGTFKRPKKALKYAMDVYGLTTPKAKKHLLDYVQTIGSIASPIVNTAITNRSMNQGMSGGMPGGLVRKHGGAQRYQTKGAVDSLGNAAARRMQGDLEKEAIVGMMNNLIQKSGMDERSAQQIMGVLSELDATEAMQYLQRINQDIESTRTEKRLLSPDMKRRGGTKRKAKYQSKGQFVPNPIPKPPKPMGLLRGERQQISKLGGKDTAQQRVEQMKYGGMCRGLPGGPNEFIR